VALTKVRVAVAQITLSRNIRELGLVKGPQGYQEPQEASLARQAEIGMLKWTLEEFVRDVKAIHHIVIIKTAQAPPSRWSTCF
jgi:arginine repressor